MMGTGNYNFTLVDGVVAASYALPFLFRDTLAVHVLSSVPLSSSFGKKVVAKELMLWEDDDDYFHVRHRGERRGVGGLFFDDMNEAPKDECYAFVEACAGAFLPSYLPILERRRGMPYTDEQRDWQQLGYSE